MIIFFLLIRPPRDKIEDNVRREYKTRCTLERRGSAREFTKLRNTLTFSIQSATIIIPISGLKFFSIFYYKNWPINEIWTAIKTSSDLNVWKKFRAKKKDPFGFSRFFPIYSFEFFFENVCSPIQKRNKSRTRLRREVASHQTFSSWSSTGPKSFPTLSLSYS